MTEHHEILERAAQTARETLGEGPSPERQASQVRRLVNAQAKVRTTRSITRLAVAVGAVIFAAIAVAYLAPVMTGRLSFVSSDGKPREAGEWLRSVAGEKLTLSFEDGSRITLEGASGRVREVGRRTVAFVLDAGTLSAEIVHRENVAWTVEAGPYRVEVVGTAFRVAWEPRGGVIDVSVSRGKVAVSGGGIADERIMLSGGQLFHAEGGAYRVGYLPSGSAADKPVISTSGEADRPDDLEPPARASSSLRSTQRIAMRAPQVGPSTSGQDTSVPANVRWKDLYASGSYREALDAVGEHEFDGLVARLDQPDLWALADAARFAGDGKKAQRALAVFRERFSGTARAKTAAFLLGRVSVELVADPASAARWFGEYLREEPKGALAEESLGRLIDASMKAGQIERARGAAAMYVQDYPDGIFSALARNLLEKK